MRKIIVALFFLSCLGAYAQKIKAVIVYKNGDKVSGYYKQVNQNYKFKRNKSDRFEKLEPEEIQSIDYLILTKKKERLKYGFTSYGLLKIAYYGTHIMAYSNDTYDYGFGSVGARQITKNRDFYLKKKDQKLFWRIPSGTLIGFKKSAKEFFEDCPAIITKIENKTFRKKDVLKMARFYDRTCKGVKPKRRGQKG